MLLQFLACAALAQGAADRREWPRTDFARITVEWGEILSGGPPKDGIPAIDRPRFVSAGGARAWLRHHEPVIVLRVGGEARAYPLQILTFHEIVNDVVAGKPVVVTFCPLCNAAIVAKVLSRDTGHERPYGRNPYAGYDRIDQSPFLFKGRLDDRLPPMERVLAVESRGSWRLYPLSLLQGRPLVQGELRGVPYVVFARDGMASALDDERIEDGRRIPAAAAFDRCIGKRVLDLRFRVGSWFDSETGSRWNLFGESIEGPLKGTRLDSVGRGVHFAFAWLAFRPDSEIVRSVPG